MSIPTELHTARLTLRPWRADDAIALLPVLEANQAHLGPWIPARVSNPAPVPLLAERLDGFAADFVASREWRFAMIVSATGEILGEVGLFPRNATGRVPFADADRVEVGYWLRMDRTGAGFVTEAARAVLSAASAVPQFTSAEIRCDRRNAPSGAVAERLGFRLVASGEPTTADPAPDGDIQVWGLEIDHED
jgi:ribosomal-protein-serine acetyltransferase